MLPVGVVVQPVDREGEVVAQPAGQPAEGLDGSEGTDAVQVFGSRLDPHGGMWRLVLSPIRAWGWSMQ